MGIAYAEHPVSKSEKDALLKQGFDKVLDIRFAPENLGNGDKKITKPKKAKAAEAKAAAEFSPGEQVSLETGLPPQ